MERFLELLRAGNYIEPSCRAAGFSYDTYGIWMTCYWAAHEMVNRHEELDPKSEAYHAAGEQILQAIAQSEVALQAMVRDQAPNDWKAAIELLARRWPDRWSNRAQMRITHDLRPQGPSASDEAVSMKSPTEAGELADMVRALVDAGVIDPARLTAPVVLDADWSEPVSSGDDLAEDPDDRGV
jgi:hypothetical protein